MSVNYLVPIRDVHGDAAAAAVAVAARQRQLPKKENFKNS